MWFKVDDQLPFHPKVVRAGNAAMGLWVRGGSWSARYLTDGYVPADVIATMVGKAASLPNRLIDSGLWVPDHGGFRFHDWDAYQPSADDWQQFRSSAEHGNHIRWHVRRGVINPACKFCVDHP